MRVVIIVNSEAGSASGFDAQAVISAGHDAGAQVSVQMVPGAALAERARELATSPEVDVVVAAGGDGTVNSVAGAVCEAGGLLGVIPLGTLNHFAKDLGMPLDPSEAITAIANSQERHIDLAFINSRVVLNNCSFGAYPEAVRQRDLIQRRGGLGKWPAMTAASWRTFRRMRVYDLRLDIDGQHVVVEALAVLIGNNRYDIANIPPGGRVRLDGGELGVYVISETRHFAYVRVVTRLLMGRLLSERNVDCRVAKRVELEAVGSGEIPVAIDGEPVELAAPLIVETKPGALRVMAPAQQI